MEGAQWLTIFQQGMGKHRSQRTGYLYLKPKVNPTAWYLQYRVDSNEIDPKTGKKKRPKVTVRIGDYRGPNKLTEREAERESWNNYLSKVDVMSLRPGSSMTLEEFVRRRWRPDRLEHLSAKGRQSYETQLRNHILPILGKKPLRDIGLAQVQDLVNQRANWISPKTGKKLEPESLERIVSTLKALFSHARRMDCITARPTDGVKLPKVREKEKPSLTWPQVEVIAAALPEPIATLVLFLTWTGLRIGEAMGLRWARLNLTAEPRIEDGQVIPPLTVLVRENFVMGRYQDLKTRKSRRDVPIPKELAQRMAALIGEHGLRTPVFVNASGSAPIDHHNVASRILKPTVKTLGLPWVSWHTFRHTNASLSEQAGLTVSQRMMILGHSDRRTTRLYTHADLQSARTALGKIGKPN